MHVKRLHLHGFRNLASQDLDLVPGINVVTGDNGQGKTNLLEAVHVLSCMRSFRPARLVEMIRHEQQQARITGAVESGGIPIQLRMVIEVSGRRTWLGERPVRNVEDYLGLLNVVAFTPDDLSMIKGAPAVRRRLLDRAAFLFWPDHLLRVREFTTALRNRNRLLQTTGALDEILLQSFSETMVRAGALVSERRNQVVQVLANPLGRILGQLLRDSGQVQLRFRPGWEVPDDPADYQQALLSQLSARLHRDRQRQSTGVGPQLDDLEVQLEGQSARKFASQGQQRTLAVALLLSIVSEMGQRGAERPVILLDDVSSELDAGRRTMLFDQVRALGSQVLITTTDESLVTDLVGDSRTAEVKRFRVHKGVVSAVEADAQGPAGSATVRGDP